MNDAPDEPTGDRVPSPERSAYEGESSQGPTPAEHTRPLPPYQQPQPERATAPARRGSVTAALLVGALLVGGAAGVGGAAWYDAWQGDVPVAAHSSTPGSGEVISADNSPARAQSIQKVADEVLPSVVKINVTGPGGSGSGSGIILTASGKILTNNHVVAVAGQQGTITVNFNDGKTVRASVIGTDPVTDVAVIQAKNVSGLDPATIGNSDSLDVGQKVVAIGSPYGLNSTVTSGIVSALHRPVSVATAEPPQQPSSPFGDGNPFDPFGQSPQQSQSQDLSTIYPAIQTDAAINPGNSGGPLVDLAGRVVGINSSIRTSGAQSTGGEPGSIGLGFAIPINEVLPIVKEIVNHETPTHARLGVTVSDLRGGSLEQGALIHSVVSGAAADGAGLRKGDVITKVDQAVIDGSESLVATIRGHRPGDTVTLTYLRGHKTHTTTLRLGSDLKTTAS